MYPDREAWLKCCASANRGRREPCSTTLSLYRKREERRRKSESITFFVDFLSIDSPSVFLLPPSLHPRACSPRNSEQSCFSLPCLRLLILERERQNDLKEEVERKEASNNNNNK